MIAVAIRWQAMRIRCFTDADTGRVVVLDPRIVTKPYGRAFRAALPEGVRIETQELDIADGVDVY